MVLDTDILPAETAPAIHAIGEQVLFVRRRLYRALLSIHGDAFLACESAAMVSNALRKGTPDVPVVLRWTVPIRHRPTVALVDAAGTPQAQLQFPRAFPLSTQTVVQLAQAMVTRSQRELLAELENRNQRLIEIQGGLEEAVQQRTRELEAARAQAEAGARSKSRFLANMSHEIRTPMNAIIGLAHLTLRAPLSPPQQHNVQRIHQAGTSLLGIINDILDFSKIEAGKMTVEHRPFLLASVLSNVETVVGQQARNKGLQFSIHVDANVPLWLVGDSLRIGQILNNLAGNAVKFTRVGHVEIQIRATEEPLEQTPEQVSVTFTVRDTGEGMDQTQLDQLYQPFMQADQTTTRRFGGTGLGLTICRQLVQLMNGTMHAESTVGQGSTFHVNIPLGRLSDHVLSSLRLDHLAETRLLLVDDDPDFHETTRDLLEAHIAELHAVSSAGEALRIASERAGTSTAFNTFLIDWHLPKQSGLEVARRLRESGAAHAQTQLFLVTAYRSDELTIHHSTVSIDQVLYKPLGRETLLAMLGSAEGRPVHQGSTDDLTGLRVLLAEDNAINREIAQSLIESWGAEVHCTHNGMEACIALETAEDSHFDVVLMDLQMPVMDGYGATRRIRTQTRFDTLPIYAMTAHALPEDLAQIMDSGMQGRVTKPIEPEILHRTLAALHTPTTTTPTPPQAPTATRPHTPPLLEPESGMARAGGNAALYIRLVSDFVANNPVAQWQTRLQHDPTAQQLHALHGLKGVAGNLGLTRLTANTTTLEELLQQRPTLPPAALHQWLDTLAETLAAITEQWPPSAQPPPPSAHTPGPQAALEDVQEQVRAALEDADSLADVLLIQHADLLKHAWGADGYQRVLTLAQDFLFEDAMTAFAALPTVSSGTTDPAP